MVGLKLSPASSVFFSSVFRILKGGGRVEKLFLTQESKLRVFMADTNIDASVIRIFGAHFLQFKG